MKNRLTCILFAVAAIGIFTCDQTQAGKPRPPSSLPPVRYRVQFWEAPDPAGYKQINGMNNLGQAVGYNQVVSGERHAFLYNYNAANPEGSPISAIDLHDVMSALGHPVIDGGWVIASGIDINDFGVIVGSLEPAGSPFDPNFRRGFMLDTNNWTLEVLPDFAWDYSYPLAINENGDVAGLFRNIDQTFGAYFVPAGGMPVLFQDLVKGNVYLNNPSGSRPAQVVGQRSDGTPFRWTTDPNGYGVVEYITVIKSPSVEGINDAGTISGSTLTSLRKLGSSRYPMRYNTSLEILSGGDGWARRINSSGDFLNARLSGVEHIFHDAWGYLNPNDLIDLSDADANAWFAASGFGFRSMSDRNATGFGVVCGSLNRTDGTAVLFHLTPVPAP